METTHARQLAVATKALRASLVTLVTRVDALCDLLDRAPERQREPVIFGGILSEHRLRLERATFTVRWNSRICVLGHTMAFEVMARLCRHPDEYIPLDHLIDDLWPGSRTYSTVRSTVCRLRTKLRAEGMAELAARIDGGTRGHYRLRLSGP